MENVSILHPIVKAPELPAFVARRVDRFHNERVAIDWGGRHILRGRRPSDGDLMLQSNDYLAIAGHPDIVEAQRDALATGGLGMMMSALFQQDADQPLHRAEAELARAVGSEDGILAQSGFAANVGLIQSLAGERIPVYIDMLAHASLWEGIRSAGAKAVPVLHNDVAHLERQVLRNGAGVIVVDAVYSTNGSLAPLTDIAAVAEAHGCVLVVDESHSLGTHGARGEGLVASLGLNDRVHFITASLAKAYCSRAGFIACTTRFKDYFGCEALPAIFSSSLLPHELAGLSAAHRVIQTEGWRRQRLRAVTRRVRHELTELGYPIGDGTEQIIAFEAGQEILTGHVRDVMERHGIFGSVFSAPATTVNRSLLRLTLNAGMSDGDVERLLHACRVARDDMALPTWSAARREQREQGKAAAAEVA
ncbi:MULTISPECIES: alpha-hydroxyketone-type quorum-sensing autoinducer synthase [unclassified Luteibacter]|uniref:alpha-hydroxyketone-type quorum-sensing autoinducer synthase n=1 Tax=unclassified Luteibacter TaxID=2620188 RepID=UPI0008B6C485|nr:MULTISPECIES: alpha-hydroxyketone-type quorum-sensing autoinducer synthase [unclassified Luteibacter]MDR6936308.1 CAI-1 autoinducer synthase [Luteibacter sp. 3190]SEV86676.1 CAI-1 autoinducer synthase [Luteibacter sp. 329MFSha]